MEIKPTTRKNAFDVKLLIDYVRQRIVHKSTAFNMYYV